MENSGTQLYQAPASRRGLFLLTIGAALVIGLLGRLWLTSLSARWAYVWDHFDNIGMGLTAEHYGLTKVYAVDPDKNPQMIGQVYAEDGRTSITPRWPPRIANYPPLGIATFWLNSRLLGLSDRSVQVEVVWPDPNVRRTITVDVIGKRVHVLVGELVERELPDWRGRPYVIQANPSVLVNTFRTRIIMSIPSVLAELILAIGMFLLGRDLLGRRAGLIAACVCWLFPPLAMDSSFWGQTDSWFLAPTVFFVWLMLRRRWAAAGLCAALAALLKPQGVLLAPIALFGAAVVGGAPAESQAPSWTPAFLRAMVQSLVAPAARGKPGLFAVRLGKMAGAGLLAIFLVTLPWMISDGLSWVDKSYIANFTMYAETTLLAFNVWYIDALSTDASGSLDGLDSKVTLLGTAKTSWGRLLALAAMVVLAVMSWRKYRHKPAAGLVIFSGLWLWSTFIWPTGVHERYIAYGMPLVILSAVALKRLWPAVVVLALVGAAEMTHNVWVKYPVGAFAKYARNVTEEYYSRPPDQRASQAALDAFLAQQREVASKRRESSVGWEYLATLGSLGAYFWAVVAAFWGRPLQPSAPPAPHHEPRRRKQRR